MMKQKRKRVVCLKHKTKASLLEEGGKKFERRVHPPTPPKDREEKFVRFWLKNTSLK
jgi:hypothetical protein